MDFGLPERTIKTLLDFFKSIPEIYEVKIYGSRATGRYQKGSDIDFCISTTGEKNISGNIMGELDELPTPYKYDVCDYKYIAHEELKKEINKYGKNFYIRD